jgi:hypothetical protein
MVAGQCGACNPARPEAATLKRTASAKPYRALRGPGKARVPRSGRGVERGDVPSYIMYMVTTDLAGWGSYGEPAALQTQNGTPDREKTRRSS